MGDLPSLKKNGTLRAASVTQKVRRRGTSIYVVEQVGNRTNFSRTRDQGKKRDRAEKAELFSSLSVCVWVCVCVVTAFVACVVKKMSQEKCWKILFP